MPMNANVFKQINPVTPGSGYFVTSNGDVTKYPDPDVTRLALTREGLFVSDMIMAELMKV